jgi:hypothetical protein
MSAEAALDNGVASSPEDLLDMRMPRTAAGPAALSRILRAFCAVSACSGRLLKHVASPPHAPPDAAAPRAPRAARPVPSVSSALAAVTAESLLVDPSALPGLPRGGALATRQWAGLLPVPYAGRDVYGRIFHWLFAPSAAAEAAEAAPGGARLPLVVWMNGGPGCSSMDGLFLENGPYRFRTRAGELALNPWSWHQKALGSRSRRRGRG